MKPGPKVGTIDSFLRKAQSVHGDKFTYDKAEYVNSRTPLTITCPVHGDFLQRPRSHISGDGCPRCRVRSQQDTADFVSRCKGVHGERYDYSLVEYENSVTKVNIVCREHGSFLQQPASHLSGKGCAKCAGAAMSLRKAHTAEVFITKAREVHGDKYSYEEVDYVASQTNVNITCKVHGVFAQRPTNHLSGKGCSGCTKTGFSSVKPAYLYVLTSGNITKVGITNRDLTLRVDEIGRSSALPFTVLALFSYKTGRGAMSVETSILRSLHSEYKRVEMLFGGSTECYMDVDREDLLSKLQAAYEAQAAQVKITPS